ncbi:TetR family transcriptional regulator [Streptomyces sp. SL13]|uniref:TetR family transcriptional regulator n=1 Tax=Streptantibioticus silvisoli TaxID=2705255 RepID=A0AA90KJ64_9ACTN|nr:TetR/AcrR family transcriptional regulator [Streptantibioticus silvisoli]MDI5967029.1 TetR family transcriptional regulator [Streptantibioticus silvisoli]MDI5974235.1 TetR family transcriptional regulator [Streptantibioticus silvisoli]
MTPPKPRTAAVPTADDAGRAAPGAGLGLRERKKWLTRRAILEAAGQLFEEHGYEGVTVARIADEANVSVKTLFTYFDSKEDLVFGDEVETRDALVAAVRERPAGASALEGMRAFLAELAASADDVHGLEGFHTTFGEVPALRSRLLVMFERFEEALAGLLAEETGATGDDPTPRLVAAQLVSLLRLITSQEVRRRVDARPAAERRAALLRCVDDSAALLSGGLAGYAIRT